MTSPDLCVADPSTFWPWRRWPEFSAWPDKSRTVVILPIVGFSDWGLGHPLDAEETVLLPILREASQRRPASLPLLVVPPLRFVFGPSPGCAFAVDAPTAHALLAEWTGSIVSSGFRRIVFLNASPWNEEICAAASRDLRLKHDVQIFRVALPGLGLDFHLTRSPDRRRVQTVLTALFGREPDPAAPGQPVPSVRWGEEPVAPLLGASVPLDEARRLAPGIVSAAADRLLGLLLEIQARPPPAHGFAVS